MITLTPFSQTDPKWSQTIMKPGTLNLGQAGCLVTSCAMCLSNFGIVNKEDSSPVTPGQLCEKLSAVQGFDQYSNLILNKPAQIWSSVGLIDRQFTSLYPMPQIVKVEVGEAIKRIRRLISMGFPVCLNVDASKHDKIPDHWVVAYDNLPNDFQIIDAIDGKALKLSSRYDFADKAVFGYMAWIGAPTSFPNIDNGGLPQDGVTAWKLSQAIKGISKDMYLREAFDNLINP